METVRILLASTLIAGATGSIVFTQAEETIAPPATGVRDFDFLIGEWHVHHHRLKPGSHEWVDFEGTASNRKLMDGGANMEEHVLDAPYGPYRAIACARTIRIQTNGRSGGSTDATLPARSTRQSKAGSTTAWVLSTAITCKTANRCACGSSGRTSHWHLLAGNSLFHPMAERRGQQNWVMNFRRDSANPRQGAPEQSDAHDFDFLRGDWRVHHRYLRVKDNGREWLDVDGTATHRELMDGRANLEEYTINAPSGAYRAVALRSYDPKSSQWSIWWLDGRAPHVELDPPVQGRFEKGVGTFYGHTTINRKSMRVRFVWSQITDTFARWEQAYSPDEGNTWETNWTMEFRRAL